MLNKQDIIENLEEHAKECLTKLQDFKRIQAEYNQAAKALRVFRGDPLVHTNGGGSRRHPREGRAQDNIFKLLKDNPKGQTAKQMIAHLDIPKNTLASGLKHLKLRGEKIIAKPVAPGSRELIYSLGK